MADIGQADASQTSPSAAISNLVVRLFNEYTGRGPTRARAYLNDDMVTVVLKETLTKAERTLVDTGRDDEILRMRAAFQQTMRDDMIQGVETILDRKVHAFLSANHLEPDIAVETFLLAPRAARDEEWTDTSPPGVTAPRT